MRLHLVLTLLLIGNITLSTSMNMCNALNQQTVVPNCKDDGRIQARATDGIYRINWCIDENCTRLLEFPCQQNVCNTFTSLFGLSRPEDCNSCETLVEAFLNNYCGNLTLIANLTTARNSITSKCNQPTVPSPNTTGGFQATPTMSSTEGQSPLSSEANSGLASEVNNGPVVALGILLALSMVLLAAVTIGWVTTYLIMKKREVAKNSTCTGMDNGSSATVNTVDNDEDERYFQNPTYGEGGPSTNNRTDTTTTGAGAMYAVVDQLSRRTRPTAITTENSRQQDSNSQYATLTEARISKKSTQTHMTSQESNGQSDYYEIDKDFMDDNQES